MNVGLNETDILVALESYVRSKYPIPESEVITFDFKAGRKGNGPTAYAKFESDELSATHTAQYGTVLDDGAGATPEETVSDATVAPAPVTEAEAPAPTPMFGQTPSEEPVAPVAEVTSPEPVSATVTEPTDTIDIEEAIANSQPEPVRAVDALPVEVTVDTPAENVTVPETPVDEQEEKLSSLIADQAAPVAETTSEPVANSPFEENSDPSTDIFGGTPEPEAEIPDGSDPIDSIFS